MNLSLLWAPFVEPCRSNCCYELIVKSEGPFNGNACTYQWLFAAGASDVLPLENTEATVLFRSDGPVQYTIKRSMKGTRSKCIHCAFVHRLGSVPPAHNIFKI